jgi:uncharacterized protein YbjT (DUF2867 family)
MKNITSESQVLVVGATGFLGMGVCRQLKATHKNVFGLVRKTATEDKVKALKQCGIQLVEGDLKDKASIKSALNGINIVISTASSTFSRQDGDSIQTVDNEGQANLADEAIAAGIQQYIYISFPSMPGEFPLQDAKRRVEKKLVTSNIPYTILQPTFFAEAWLSPAVGFDFVNAKATLYGEGKNKISWITIQDVAAFAVACVDNPSAKNKTIELGGPEALSPLEVVSIFENTIGRQFEVQHVPVEALQAQKNAAPDDLSKTFASLMLSYAIGNEINMQQTLKMFPVKLNFVQDYANSVLKPNRTI